MSGRVRIGFVGSDWFGVGFGSSSGWVQLGSGQFQLRFSGFGFLVNQLLNLMARQRREVISKCSTHQTQVRLFTKGERRGSRGLGSTLKSEKKIQNITKTMYYLLCIFSAITQITYLIIIFTLNKTAENGPSFEFSFLKKSFEKDRLCDGHFLNIRKYKHIFKWTLKIVNSSFLN